MSAIGQNGPLIGQIADVLKRLRATLPPWFPPAPQSPVLQSVLTGPADQFNFIYQYLQFAANQTRISTATGGWLNLIAWDFFGSRFGRRASESDVSFQSRLLKELVRSRQTRAAITQMVTDLVGTAPQIYEPWNPNDNGGYAVGSRMGYSLAGSYGSLLFPNQTFITTLQPPGNGIPNIAGYGSSFNGYGAVGGLGEYADYGGFQGPIPSAEIYARISQVIAAGTIAWVDIVGKFKPPIIGPGMYPPWRIGGFDNRTNDVVVAGWVPPPPPPWMGNLGELYKRNLAPIIENVPVNNPPFGGYWPNDAITLAGILAAWLPYDPWFVNGPQPYDSRDLPVVATQVTVNVPPLLAAGQLPTNIELAVDAWRPPDPFPIEIQQAWALRRVSPTVLNNPPNAPPLQIGGYGQAFYDSLVDAWRAPDPTPFEGGWQPAQPFRLAPSLITVPVNNPPFVDGAPKTQTLIVSSWTPPDPSPLYWQPYAPKLLSPQLTNNPGQQPPAISEQSAILQGIAVQVSQPPDPLPTLWPPQPNSGNQL